MLIGLRFKSQKTSGHLAITLFETMKPHDREVLSLQLVRPIFELLHPAHRHDSLRAYSHIEGKHSVSSYRAPTHEGIGGFVFVEGSAHRLLEVHLVLFVVDIVSCIANESPTVFSLTCALEEGQNARIRKG